MHSNIRCNNFFDENISHAFLNKNINGSSHKYCNRDSQNLNKNSEEIKLNHKLALEFLEDHSGQINLLKQIHSNKALFIDEMLDLSNLPEGDALVTNVPGLVIGIYTADCVPIIFSDCDHKIIACAHAGWRGAKSGIIENTVKLMQEYGANNIKAAIGPCIQQESYEVDENFYKEFLDENESNKIFFLNSKNSGHFMFNLPAYVVHKLNNLGINQIYNMNIDSFTNEDYFSYRRVIKNNLIYKHSLISMIKINR